MDLKGVILKTFNDTIRMAEINSELKASLREHPKTVQLLNNLHRELLAVDALRRSQGKKAISAQTIQDTVKDFTHNFITGVDIAAQRRVESDLKRIARETEEQKKKDLELASDGKFQGEYEELKDSGLKIGETHVREN